MRFWSSSRGGLARNAGHESEVVDLYAIRFDPVLKPRDAPNWANDSLPVEALEGMNLKKQAIESATNPVQRLATRIVLRNKSTSDILKMAWKLRPRDVVEQQNKVAGAQGLAFISPIWFVGFPAILKGWIERVYTPGFAFGLKMEGWNGSLKGRVPLLKHDKVLIINTTLFDQQSYEGGGLRDAMTRLIDDFAFRYPGVKKVEHTYYYAVHGVSAEISRATWSTHTRWEAVLRQSRAANIANEKDNGPGNHMAGGRYYSKEESAMSSRCETCGMRLRAEKKPSGLLSWIWRWHTGWCPMWKAYQAELANRPR